MANCLKTQLKSTVNNEFLPKIGEFKFRVKVPVDISQGGATIVINSYDNSYTVTVPSDKHIYDSTHTVIDTNGVATLSGYKTVYIMDAGEYYVSINSKYNVWFISGFVNGSLLKNNISLSDFKYFENLKTLISSSKLKGDFSDLLPLKEHLSSLTISQYPQNDFVTGTTEIIGQFTQMSNLVLSGNRALTGNISELRNLKSLNIFKTDGTTISGEITDLADAMVSGSNPRTSGSLAITCNGIITLNGDKVSFGTKKTITFDSSIPDGYSII